jgi:hypothetical protein
MSKMQNLQQALRESTGKSAAKHDAPLRVAPSPTPTPATPPRSQGRADQVNISAWLHPDFKSSLRLVQARKGRNATLQDLMSEALNDLFVKYDVPTIRQEKP